MTYAGRSSNGSLYRPEGSAPEGFELSLCYKCHLLDRWVLNQRFCTLSLIIVGEGRPQGLKGQSLRLLVAMCELRVRTILAQRIASVPPFL